MTGQAQEIEELLAGAKLGEGQNYKSIKLQVFEGLSPAIEKQNITPNRKLKPKKLLSTPKHHKKIQEYTYKSPLDNMLDEIRQKTVTKELEVAEKNKQYMEFKTQYESNRTEDTSINLCHKCHTRAGHNQNKCPSSRKCPSALICKRINMHDQESKIERELCKKLKIAKGELANLKAEEEKAEQRMKSVLRDFDHKVHTRLVRSDPDKYLIAVNNEAPFENWEVINCDMAILRDYYKSKTPPPGDDDKFQDIINNELKKKEPVLKKDAIRQRLEENNIKFPEKEICNDSPPAKVSVNKKKETNNEDDDLKLAMKLSMEEYIRQQEHLKQKQLASYLSSPIHLPLSPTHGYTSAFLPHQWNAISPFGIGYPPVNTYGYPYGYTGLSPSYTNFNVRPMKRQTEEAQPTTPKKKKSFNMDDLLGNN